MKPVKVRSNKAFILFSNTGQVFGMNKAAVDIYKLPESLIIIDDKVPSQKWTNKFTNGFSWT